MNRNRMGRGDTPDVAVAEVTGRVMDFFEVHGRNLIIGLVVLVVVIAALFFFRSSLTGDERTAASRLAEANNELAQGQIDPAAAKLTEIITRYGGSKSGKRARLLMGSVELARGNNAAADAQFQAFLSNVSTDDYLWTIGQRGRAAALENAGKYAEAAGLYESLLKGSLGNDEKGRALLDAARARRLGGDTAGARSLYARIVREFSGTRAVTQAKMQLGPAGTK